METYDGAELGAALPDRPLDGAQGTRVVRGKALLQLAHATIGLSKVAPRLNELAVARQDEAERQAERATEVTALTRQMSESLAETVGTLRTATSEIADLAELIRRIAEQTSLIAINTGVAAAHAGAQGKVFSVLSQEIRTLSQNTTAAARDVETKIRRLQESAERTASVVGLDANKRASKQEDGPGLAWVLGRMEEAQASSTRQATEARELTHLGGELRALSELMIRSVGAFRLDAHRRAESLLEELRMDPGLCSHELPRKARALRLALELCPPVELAYVTDLRGVQVTENIARKSFSASYGNSGVGQDWSARPWFQGALRSPGVFSSEIYRSVATDEFCLTVAATYGPGDGSRLGVVALDLNFRQLLGDSP